MRLGLTISFVMLITQACGDFPSKTSENFQFIQVGQTKIWSITLSDPGVSPVMISKRHSPRSTQSFANLYDTDLAVNASFFDSRYRPFGLTKSEGVVWANSYMENRLKPDLGIFYCERNSTWTCRINFDYDASVNSIAQNANLAFTGYLQLIKNGKVVMTASHGSRARTAIGVSESGKTVYIAVVQEGYKDGNLNKLAETMRAAGAFQAINLDGGGSTAAIEKINGSQIPLIKSTRTPPVHFGFKL